MDRTRYLSHALDKELREADFTPALGVLQEYAVALIACRNRAAAVIERMQRQVELTELQEAQLNAIRSIEEIEKRRLDLFKEALTKLEHFARIPPPVWPS